MRSVFPRFLAVTLTFAQLLNRVSGNFDKSETNLGIGQTTYVTLGVDHVR